MPFFRLTISSDNGFQAVTDSPPKELLNKDLYKPYPFKTIDSIRLDLDKGCKITDALSVGTLSLDGFPIRNEFCKLIQDLNLNDIQFVEIIDKELNDYSFMFFNSDLTSKLDYQKSNFILIEDILGDISELEIKIPKNRKAVLDAYNEHCSEDIFKQLTPKNGYHFVSGFNIENLDAFRIGHFDTSFYVSERLKSIWEAHNISGLEFTKANLFDVKPAEEDKKRKWWQLGK